MPAVAVISDFPQQADRQAGRQTDRRETDRLRHTGGRQTDRHTEGRQTDRQTHRRETDRLTDTLEGDRQTLKGDGQTDRQT